jgi:hypothetical protein
MVRKGFTDMINNNDSSNNNNQFVISYELLCLLRWLTEHDAERLKKIISRAVVIGLKDELLKMEHFFDKHKKDMPEAEHNLEEIQYSIVEFFGLLEALLIESLNEHAVQQAVEKNLMPAIDHIDATVCDNDTVRTSIEKATSKSEWNSKENAQEILFKELLKRWKPQKNVMN